jgi:hypothetical protein
MSGWDDINQGLSRIGQGWEKENQYSTIDIAKTLSNLFGGKKKPATQIVQEAVPDVQPEKMTISNSTVTPEVQSLLDNVGVRPADMRIGTAPDKSVITPEMQSAGIYVPGASPQRTVSRSEEVKPSTDPNAFDVSALAENNPYRTKIPTNTGIVARNVRPETILAAQQWEKENEQANLANELSRMDLESRRNSYVTLDENMITQIPEQYRGYYKPGQTIAREEIMKLTPTGQTGYDANTIQSIANGLDRRNPIKEALMNLPANTDSKQVQDLINQATDYQNYLLDFDKQSGGGSDRGNIDLNRQYQGVNDAYQQYVNGLKARRQDGIVTPQTTPLSMKDWLRQPDQAGLRDIYNRFTNSNLEQPKNPLGKNKVASNNQSSTGWFKTHSTPPPGVSPQDWQDADYIMATSGGMGIKKVLEDAASKLKQGKLPQKVYDALVARSQYTMTNNIAKN